MFDTIILELCPACSLPLNVKVGCLYVHVICLKSRGDCDADEEDADNFESDVAAYEEGVADIEQIFGEVRFSRTFDQMHLVSKSTKYCSRSFLRMKTLP